MIKSSQRSFIYKFSRVTDHDIDISLFICLNLFHIECAARFLSIYGIDMVIEGRVIWLSCCEIFYELIEFINKLFLLYEKEISARRSIQ